MKTKKANKYKIIISIITLIVIAIAIYFVVQKYGDIQYQSYEVTLSMMSDISDEDINIIKKQLEKNKKISKIIYKSKKEITDELYQIEILRETIDSWDENGNPINPIYSFNIRVKSITEFNNFIEEIKTWNGYESEKYNMVDIK